MAAKPSKQQVAQAKARAGGNNPIKVTKAGVKRLGKAALIAASLTPVGRGVKIAATASKAIKATKTAKTIAAPKSAVKVVRANSRGVPNSVYNKIQTGASKKLKSGENAKNRARENASENAYLRMLNKEKTKTIKIKSK